MGGEPKLCPYPKEGAPLSSHEDTEKGPRMASYYSLYSNFHQTSSDSLPTVGAIHSPTKEAAPCPRACPGQQKREDEQRARSPGRVSKCLRIIY